MAEAMDGARTILSLEGDVRRRQVFVRTVRLCVASVGVRVGRCVRIRICTSLVSRRLKKRIFVICGEDSGELVSLPEWSKGLRSGRNVFERVGSNPTADTSFAATHNKIWQRRLTRCHLSTCLLLGSLCL